MGHRFDGAAVFFEREAISGEDGLVREGVKVGEAAGEFDLLAVHGDGTPRRLAFGPGWCGDVLNVDRQVPADAGVRA